MADKFLSFIKIDLQDKGGKLVFQSIDEIISWINSEISHWFSLANSLDANSPLRNIVKFQLEPLHKLIAFL